MSHAKAFADLLEVADLGECPHAAGDGIEHGDHDQTGQLVEVERTVTGLIAGTTVVAQVGEEVTESPQGF